MYIFITQKCPSMFPPLHIIYIQYTQNAKRQRHSLKKQKGGGTSDKTLLDYQEDAAIAAASEAVIIVYARRRRRHYPYSAPHEAFCPAPLRQIGRGSPPKHADMLDVEATVHRHNKAQEDGDAFWLSDKGGRA